MSTPPLQPVTIHGAPIDPALGLPRAVITERPLRQWLEIGFGLACVVNFVAMITGAFGSSSPSMGKYVFLSWVTLVISPFSIVDGIRRLRRRAALVVAANGFDDRMSYKWVGPVLWSEVASIGPGSKMVGNLCIPIILVTLKPGVRAPLSPLGQMPKQVDKAEIELGFRLKTRVPDALMASYNAWRDRQMYGG
jgi:hypothetical protein